MIRLAAIHLSLALGLAVAPLHAQTTRAPALPNSPAGRVLHAWLEANNSGDSTRLAAYARRYQPGIPAGWEPVPRDSLRRYDLVSIECSEPGESSSPCGSREAPAPRTPCSPCPLASRSG